MKLKLSKATCADMLVEWLLDRRCRVEKGDWWTGHVQSFQVVYQTLALCGNARGWSAYRESIPLGCLQRDGSHAFRQNHFTDQIMKLFRATTTVKASKPISTDSEFVDWYEAETLERAREFWGEDVHRYQLPADQTTVVFVECNPETLKPL